MDREYTHFLIAYFYLIGSQEVQHFVDSDEFCTNHENCEARHEQMKMTKGFVSKEPVKGHMASPPFPCYFTSILVGYKCCEDLKFPYIVSGR